METWASYAEQGRASLLAHDHAKLNHLINEAFDLRAKLYRIGEGNLEMIGLARSVGASANFAGSGGAITGAYEDEAMFQKLVDVMAPKQIAVIKPQILPKPRVR